MFASKVAKPQTKATANATSTAAHLRSTPASTPSHPRIQLKLAVGRVDDPFEREAERVADSIAGASPSAARGAIPASNRNVGHAGAGIEPARAPSVEHALRDGGRPLAPQLRDEMEGHFGCDFSRVRVHSGPAAERSAADLNAAAYTLGGHIVFGSERFAPATPAGRHLLAHELTHVVQQGGSAGAAGQLQRKVVLAGAEMPEKDRASFLKARKWSSATQARAIMDDMAAAGDSFDFTDAGELETEIKKRLSTVKHMEESQDAVPVKGQHAKAFAYPFSESNHTELYGPRVNYAARGYWEPSLSDDYADRDTKANAKKNKDVRAAKRSARSSFYSDMDPSYGWRLSSKGKANPYQAVALLFTPQILPRRRTLIHCDYLISMVNMLSLADSVGAPEFNRRVAGLGTDQFVLRFNAFTDLHALSWIRDPSGVFKNPFVSKTGLASTQQIRPSSPADLIIGDHVIFFNHLAYDLLNQGVGNAWRLENAVLVKRGTKPAGKHDSKAGSKGDPDTDLFLGHGSGYRTAGQMRAKLAEEFNKVWTMADAAVKGTQSKDAKTKSNAEKTLSDRNVKKIGADFRVMGIPPLQKESGCSHPFDQRFADLKHVSGKDVIGPMNPCNPAEMYHVERPIESAK
jgi:hypothetical protein